MMTISLPSRLSDDLRWLKPRQIALQALERGDKIFWEFDLGLSSPYFPLEDELTFQALSLSLTTFSKELWPLFQEATEGVCLYRGSADFSSFFTWTEKQQALWSQWCQERPEGKEEHLRRLFCADAFAFYFQMLSHRLPDELPISLSLEVKECGIPLVTQNLACGLRESALKSTTAGFANVPVLSHTLAEALQIVSKERFEHFLVDIQGISLSYDSPLALCFPEESQCSQKVLEKLDLILDQLDQPVRIIQEPYLTELWEGVEYLYVLSEAVTPSGHRKLKGFCASGGTVLVEGDLMGLSQEIRIEEIRGRGIRTPGLLVPNQSR
jgi:hypothetical protein